MAHRVVFGKTSFIKAYCKECESESFVIDGVLSCCDVKPEAEVLVESTFYATRSQEKRKGFSPAFRRKMVEEQNNCCFYCGESFDGLYSRDGRIREIKVHIDHVHPFSVVGNSTELVAACNVCNLIKSNKIFDNIDVLREYIKKQKIKKGIKPYYADTGFYNDPTEQD